MIANKEIILKRIEDGIDALYDEAQIKVDRFWKENLTEEMGKDKRNQSRIGVRTRYRNGTLTIDWFFNSFVPGTDEHGKTTWKVYSTQIRKPAGKTMYSEGPLKKQCRDWEVERVLEYEREFALIRTEYAGLSKARSALRTMDRQIARLQSGD